jgi:hypothetical protein
MARLVEHTFNGSKFAFSTNTGALSPLLPIFRRIISSKAEVLKVGRDAIKNRPSDMNLGAILGFILRFD